MGPFTLFWQLKEFHDKDNDSDPTVMKKTGIHSNKYTGVLKEIS